MIIALISVFALLGNALAMYIAIDSHDTTYAAALPVLGIYAAGVALGIVASERLRK